MSTEGFGALPQQKFETPHDELSFLKERLSHLEKQIETGAQEATGEHPLDTLLREYASVPPAQVLHEKAILPAKHIEQIVLKLAPEEHDHTMSELLALVQEKGVRNALSVVYKMNNPHLLDDFHRFLAEYLREGYMASDLNDRAPLYRALNMTLYEVSLPDIEKEQAQKELKTLISGMEQFYSGMRGMSLHTKHFHMSIEIAQSSETEEVVFYVSVPTQYKDLFEKHLLGIFSHARITEQNNDYNVFNESGETVVAYATLKQSGAFPLKTYDLFDTDPLNVVLNSFSKLTQKGEGAAIQLVLKPAEDSLVDEYKKAFEKIQKGTSVKEALNPKGVVHEIASTVMKELFGFGQKSKEKEEKIKMEKKQDIDQLAVEHIKKKIESPLYKAVLRVVSSAPTKPRAESIHTEMISAFNQFEQSTGNKIVFKVVTDSNAKRILNEFTFRLFRDDESIVLNSKELTTMVHFPVSVLKSASLLKRAKAGTAPAPLILPETGVILGVNRHRTEEKMIRFGVDDRVRHFYVIGQTGTGKTTLLKNMIIQDIQNGEGVCMIDPHGSDLADILANIPKERADDVIYFDPAYTPRPMGLNMLEYDTRYPEQKTFMVDELLSIFNKLFDMKVAGGPMFEQYFRNAALLVMDDPSTGNTLIDINRVLASKEFRSLKLSRCSNPIVVQFWREIAEKAGGESSLQNMIPYISNKFDVFLSNEIMRPVIGQEKSAFNFREIMDTKKILLVNLSKGRLGEINANLIGLVLVGKILMAALSRVDARPGTLPPFYLYIDEFQNVTTNSISSILSEARKYGLGLTIAHQFIKQLDEKIKDSVFGNVGSMCAFRTSAEDAEYLEKQFGPTFTASDIMNLDNRNAYLRLLINGRPEKPFNIATLAPERGSDEIAEYVKQLSYAKYGRDRAEVEQEVMARYQPKPLPPQAPPPFSI